MNYLYVIKSKEGYQYIGSTTDLRIRIYQHKNKLAGWTKRGTEWKLVYFEKFEKYAEAKLSKTIIKD